MAHEPTVRKKWSERQFELFVDATKEFGTIASQQDFEQLLDQILPVQEPRRRRRKESGSKDGTRE